MSKHTPGPWRVCGGHTPKFKAIHSSQGYIVFSMADYVDDTENNKPIKAPDYETQSANARLMAASPELLDVLIKMTEKFEFHYEASHPLIQEAKRVIAKAKK